jgi:hypothetical protein
MSAEPRTTMTLPAAGPAPTNQLDTVSVPVAAVTTGPFVQLTIEARPRPVPAALVWAATVAAAATTSLAFLGAGLLIGQAQ